jgi:hypothetical protein
MTRRNNRDKKYNKPLSFWDFWSRVLLQVPIRAVRFQHILWVGLALWLLWYFWFLALLIALIFWLASRPGVVHRSDAQRAGHTANHHGRLDTASERATAAESHLDSY